MNSTGNEQNFSKFENSRTASKSGEIGMQQKKMKNSKGNQERNVDEMVSKNQRKLGKVCRNLTHQNRAKKLRKNSRKLTICLGLFVAALTVLSPLLLNLHLTHEVGLFLMEAEVVELRSSLFNVISSTAILLIVHSILFALTWLNLNKCWSLATYRAQLLIRPLISLLAVISGISYLTIALTVAPIKQVTRVPFVTFDCNANSIIIENCHQQFSSSLTSHYNQDDAGKFGNFIQSNWAPIKELLEGDINEQNDDERLIKRLDCLRYSTKQEAPPTRFLLHNCGLVCKPHYQHLNQFNDDLNREQLADPEDTNQGGQSRVSYTANDSSNNKGVSFNQSPSRLNPPYDSNFNSSEQNLRQTEFGGEESSDSKRNEVSLKICFSDEFSQGSSYQQFCITNLANHNRKTSSISHGTQQHDRSLTVGQLNRVLRTMSPQEAGEQSSQNKADFEEATKLQRADLDSSLRSLSLHDNHATNYVNPVVQFESHFRYNKPSNTSHSNERIDDTTSGWCKLRPIPPFIVNNKPFSDIQCSIEHQYVMSTKRISARSKILFKRSSLVKREQTYESSSSSPTERCNIQCKVNILYQVHRNQLKGDDSSSVSERMPKTKAETQITSSKTSQDARIIKDLHYYLPLKPCLIVSNEKHKRTSLLQYQFFRSIGDTSFLLVFLLLDLMILLESIDSNRAPFEGKKLRIFSVLVVLLMVPIMTSISFDLLSSWSQPISMLVSAPLEQDFPSPSSEFGSGASNYRNTYHITSYLKEQILSYFKENRANSTDHYARGNSTEIAHQIEDKYMIPFLVFCIIMFCLAFVMLTVAPVWSPLESKKAAGFEELTMMMSSSNLTSSLSEVQAKDRFISEMVQLFLLSLILGMQFGLMQSSPQLQLLIECFGDPTDNTTISSSQTTFKLTRLFLETYSGSVLVFTIVAIVFSDELTAFTSSFSIFRSAIKTTTSDYIVANENLDKSRSKEAISLDESRQKQSNLQDKLNFYSYLVGSLTIYALRHYVIASFNSNLSFKRLVVFLYHLIELINFPAVYLIINHRAQILLDRHLSKRPTSTELPKTSSKIIRGRFQLEWHLLVKSSLIIVYFAVGKFFSLVAHSLYTNSHLNSDDVDWFITSFYKQASAIPKRKISEHRRGNESSTISSSLPEAHASRPESLFSPLPSERQTYIFASRQFFKYSSLICGIFAAILLASLIYIKYKITIEKKRERELQHIISLNSRNESDSIDERLRTDLMQIHMTSNRPLHPDEVAARQAACRVEISADEESNCDTDSERQPRARVLFHYNVGKRPTSSSSSSSCSRDARMTPRSSSSSSRGDLAGDAPSAEISIGGPRKVQGTFKDEGEFRIPIHSELADNAQVPLKSDDATNSSIATPASCEPKQEPEYVEQIISHERKRVLLVEDDENWPDVSEDDADDYHLGKLTKGTPRFSRELNNNTELENSREIPIILDYDHRESKQQNKKKTISFAASPIMIDPNDESQSSVDMDAVRMRPC